MKMTTEEKENCAAHAKAVCELTRLQLDARILEKAIQAKREECENFGAIGYEMEKARKAKA